MKQDYAILPCNGIDKCAGCVSGEVAKLVAEQTNSEILCPVFYRVSDTKYNNIAQEKPLLIIDGCATRCASKLAAEKNLKISHKINVSDEAKKQDIELGKTLRLSDDVLRFAKDLAYELCADKQEEAASTGGFFPSELNYQTYQKDKFIFRIPDNKGFYFNENDVWAYVSGNRARIGVTDFVQKSLSDILFFNPPETQEVQQFDEAGSLEAAKAVFEIVNPVSGKITAINEKLNDTPELVNENPYEVGWIAELELADFEEDKDLLHQFDEYFPILKRKVDEFNV